jgi:hypothetical protein
MPLRRRSSAAPPVIEHEPQRWLEVASQLRYAEGAASTFGEMPFEMFADIMCALHGGSKLAEVNERPRVPGNQEVQAVPGESERVREALHALGGWIVDGWTPVGVPRRNADVTVVQPGGRRTMLWRTRDGVIHATTPDHRADDTVCNVTLIGNERALDENVAAAVEILVPQWRELVAAAVRPKTQASKDLAW